MDRDDIFAAVRKGGWSNPIQLQVSPDWYVVGEAWTATRLPETLKMFFVADYGTVYKGIDSISRLLMERTLSITFGYTELGIQSGKLRSWTGPSRYDPSR